MSGEPEPVVEFRGTALNGAVGVSLDDRGRVVSVRLHPKVVNRLGPEQLGRGVVAAHADARAARSTGG